MGRINDSPNKWQAITWMIHLCQENPPLIQAGSMVGIRDTYGSLDQSYQLHFLVPLTNVPMVE